MALTNYRVHVKLAHVNDMTPERYLRLCKGALLFLDIEIILSQGLEHFSLLSHMLPKGLIVDDNIIKINNDKII